MVVTNVVRVPPLAEQRIRAASDVVSVTANLSSMKMKTIRIKWLLIWCWPSFVPSFSYRSVIVLVSFFFSSLFFRLVSFTWPNRSLSLSPFHLLTIKMQMHALFVFLALALATSARPPFGRRADFTLKNGQDAIALKFVVVDTTLLSGHWSFSLLLVRSLKLFQQTLPVRWGRMLVLANSSLSAWTENSLSKHVHPEPCKMSCYRIFWSASDPPLCSCTALPLANKPGTSVTCDTQADADARIAAVGNVNSSRSKTTHIIIE